MASRVVLLVSLALLAAGCTHPGIRGQVVSQQPGGGLTSIPETIVEVELTNKSPYLCTIDHYALLLGSGLLASRVVCNGPVTISPGHTARASCTVGHASNLETARVVDISGACSG